MPGCGGLALAGAGAAGACAEAICAAEQQRGQERNAQHHDLLSKRQRVDFIDPSVRTGVIWLDLAGVDHDPAQREATGQHQQRRHDGVRDLVRQLQALPGHRQQHAEPTTPSPERQGVRAAGDQRCRHRVRRRTVCRLISSSAMKHQLDRRGRPGRARPATARSTSPGAAGRGAAASPRSAPPIMPWGAAAARAAAPAAMCTTATPADSPENRNSGPRMALFHSGRATIVLSRMPV